MLNGNAVRRTAGLGSESLDNEVESSHTITLSAEQERLIAEALQAGGYESANDVIARALEVLRAEDGLLHEQREEIESKIDRALAQFENGQSFTAENARSDMEQRKTDWLRDHSG